MVEKAIKIERRLKRRGTMRTYPSNPSSNQRNFQPRRDERQAGNSITPKLRQETTSNLQPNYTKSDSRGGPKLANDTPKPKNQDTKC